MNADDIMQFVDDALYAKTGKHLSDLQRGVLEGVLNYQKYADIAESLGKSEGHIKDVGYELLQLLSSVFEEPVHKSNLKSVLERQKTLIVSFGDKSINSNVIKCLNIGFDQSNESDNKNKARIFKLREHGFSDEEIADLLEIPLKIVKETQSIENK